MDSVVILHAEAETPLAASLARAWAGRSCATAQVEPARARITFGKEVVVVGLWSATTTGAAAEALIRILATHAYRAMLLVCGPATPPPAAFAAGVAVLSAGRVWDVTRLETAARQLERGQKTASDYAAPHRATRLTPLPLRPSRRDRLQRRKAAEQAIPASEARPAPPIARRGRSAARLGFGVGVVFGIVVVVALLGPWAADVATRRNSPRVRQLSEADLANSGRDSAARLRAIERSVDADSVRLPDPVTPVAVRSFGHADNDVLEGGPEAEWLSAGPGNDIVRGGPGDDRLLGGLGDDWLDGQAGNDVYWGHDGADTFSFQDSLIVGDLDVIRDFEPGVDKIALPASLANPRNTKLTRCQFGYFLSVDLGEGRVWGVVLEITWATRVVIGTDVIFV